MVLDELRHLSGYRWKVRKKNNNIKSVIRLEAEYQNTRIPEYE